MTTYLIEDLLNEANQEFDLNIDEIENPITVLLQTTVQGALLMTISVNDEIIGQPFICLPNRPVIPYPYLTGILGGNFIFETEADNYPQFEDFNNTCNLYFITNNTITEIVNG